MGAAELPRVSHKPLTSESLGDVGAGRRTVPQRTRREVLRCGALSVLGLGTVDWLRAMAARAEEPRRDAPRARRCVLIWLDGGPSHLDMFDPKPEAPQEVRGPFGTISSALPSVALSELMPLTAQQLGRVAVIRSMTSTLGEHNFGSHYLLTGYKPSPALQYPSYGSILSHLRNNSADLPSYIAVPNASPFAGAGYLPAGARPFSLGSDPSRADFRVEGLALYPGLDAHRFRRRQAMVGMLDHFAAEAEHRTDASNPLLEQAYRLLTSPDARRALDLSEEPQRVRDRYGPRTIGQSCLLARRLLEAGVPFVTVTDRGWDTHEGLVNRLQEGYTGGHVGLIPNLDRAFSALLIDLYERGMLADTLVVLMGEFGRTPKVNTAGGRDHWPRVFSVALAGAGIEGQVIGSSDAHGESPREDPVLPEELARTIYVLLGIDPDQTLTTSDGRPVAINAGRRLVEPLLS